jgi:hypothetical protein
MRLVMGRDGRRVASRHGFAIGLLDARLSFENAERNARGEVPGGLGVGDLRRAFASQGGVKALLAATRQGDAPAKPHLTLAPRAFVPPAELGRRRGR